MWSNYHTHSNYCDGKGELTKHVLSAREKKIISLGFSSHAPLPFDCMWCMRPEKLNDYLVEIEILKKTTTDIELYRGLEIDFIPEIISPDDFSTRLDYTIGSIHFVDAFEDGRRWEIDGIHSIFLDGLRQIFKGNIQEAITRYFELTRQMVEKSPPDIVGHFDKIKIQNKNDQFFHEEDAWYRNEVVRTLKTIEQAGSIVEVNTRGIYQKKSTTTYPSPWILEILYQRNIPITLSTDAHHPDDLTNQFEQTAAMLRTIGFKKISILKEGKWQLTDFTPDGISNS